MDAKNPARPEPRQRRPYVKPEVKTEPAREVYALAFTSCGLGNTNQVQVTCCGAGF